MSECLIFNHYSGQVWRGVEGVNAAGGVECPAADEQTDGSRSDGDVAQISHSERGMLEGKERRIK